MYDLYYVRKRRRRRIAALVSLIASIGVASLVVTSFLGRNTGTFTIKVVNNDVRLSLSRTSDFQESTTYLHIDQILPLRECSYADILRGVNEIDNESVNDISEFNAVNMDEQGNADSVYYMKYTFFVKNSGFSAAEYNFSLNFSDRTKSTDGTERMLDDTLRVMVYDTDLSSGENHTVRGVWAKDSPYTHYDKNNNPTHREFIGIRPYDEHETDEYELAKSFNSGTTILNFSVPGFSSEAVRRYTIVFWLEGDDKESKPDEGIPQGASVKIGVNIDAFKI